MKGSIWNFGLAVAISLALIVFSPIRFFIHSIMIQTLYVPVLEAEAFVNALVTAKAQRDSLSLENAHLLKILGIYKRALYRRRLRSSINPTLARWSGIPADALAFEPLGIPAKVVLNKGWIDGVRKDRPVIAYGSLAGKIFEVAQNSSSAITVHNRRLKVAAIIPRSGVLGVFEGGTFMLHYVPKWADVRVGDTVETSGIGPIYPYGIPIGVVEKCDTSGGVQGMFMDVRVKPFYDFTQKAVFVILR